MSKSGYFGNSFRYLSAVAALFVSVVFLALLIVRPPVIESLDEALFDRFQKMQPRVFNPDGVVRIIDIDERSLAEFGQWPWPRPVIAEMVHRVGSAGAATIAFDMTFAEADRTSPPIYREDQRMMRRRFSVGASMNAKAFLEFEAIEGWADHDTIAADTFRQYPVVLGSFLTAEPNEADPMIVSGVSPLGSPNIHEVLTTFQGVVPNIPQLAAAASGVGSVSLAEGEGTIIRRAPMFAALRGDIIPSFAVEALRVAQREEGSTLLRATDADAHGFFGGQAEVESMRVGGIVVPLDADGSLRIRFTGKQDARTFSASDILAGAALSPELAAQLAGRIILVGTSAPGLRDLRSTPIDDVVPGVEVHAEIIEQIVEQDFFTRPDWASGIERILLVVVCAVSCLLLAFRQQVAALVFAVGGIAAGFGGSWYLFADFDLLISPAMPAMALGSTYLVGTAVSFIEAEQSRREVTRQFEHFVSPEVIEDIVADPEKHLTPGGDRRELSIFFMDVQDFSTHTESMEPEEVILFLNTLLNPLTDVILGNQGTVDKYIGDSIMAFWNAPRQIEGKENRAIKAAVECIEACTGINEEFIRLGLPQIQIRIGVNTGYCSVGNMGSTKRLSYSCVGDPVNLAARLEGLTRQYHVPIMVGDSTAEAADAFVCLELDQVTVKGRSQFEKVWTVIGPADLADTAAFQDLDYHMGAGRDAYRNQDWDEAEAAFRACAAMDRIGLFDPRPTAELFIARVEEYRENPPGADWDGVYRATRK